MIHPLNRTDAEDGSGEKGGRKPANSGSTKIEGVMTGNTYMLLVSGTAPPLHPSSYLPAYDGG